MIIICMHLHRLHFIYLFSFSSRLEAHEHTKHYYNRSMETKKKRIKQTTTLAFKTGDLKNKFDGKTALISELSLICNKRHNEKVSFRIFSGNMKHCLKQKV